MPSPTELPAPVFANARALIAGALAELRFPERVSVSECAARHRMLANPGGYSGPWSESPFDMRFVERAQDVLGDPDSPYSEVAIEGPAQTAKSEIGNNWQLHTVLYDQADMLFVMPDRVSIGEYVTTQWNKMIELTPALRDRQLDGPSADNINLKQFRGCSFFFRWPSGPTFRAKPLSRGRLDDYDDIPQDIGAGAGGQGGQGDPLSLMLGRGASFSAYGGSKVYVNSTPRLGRQRGIAALRAGGTDERWHVDCVHCGEPFELDTEHCLKFDDSGTPEDAAKNAAVICRDTDCGGIHLQRDKAALMASGRWIGRGETAVSRAIVPEGKKGALIETHRLSQRWDGLMGFRRWADMARQWRQAELAYQNEQDEGPLKTFFQTVIGKNYSSRTAGEADVTEEELAQRAIASGHRWGVVPAWARCVVMAVDQQGNRFEVGAWAFGRGYRAAMIDRFAIEIFEPGGGQPAELLRPFQKPEHFGVLHPQVMARTYPAEGSGLPVKVFCTALDTGGSDGATDNAFAWWHSMVAGDVASGRPALPASAITLFKGGNKPKGRLLPPPTIDARRQMKGAPSAELYIPNVNRLKDMADVGLRREPGLDGSIAFPADVDKSGALRASRAIAEMKAETKQGELWVRPPGAANETLDLYVMARTVLLRFGGHDHSLDWVPSWARPQQARPAPASGAPAAEAAALREAQGETPSPAAEAAAEKTPPARPIVTTNVRPQLAPSRSRVRIVRAGR